MTNQLIALFALAVLASPAVLLCLGVVAVFPFFLLGAIGRFLGGRQKQSADAKSFFSAYGNEEDLWRAETQSLAEVILAPSEKWRCAG